MTTLLSNLKKLQNVRPEDGYCMRSLEAIIGNVRLRKTISMRFWESMRYSVALTFTAMIILVAIGGFSYLNWSSASPLIIGSLNAKSITAEADRVNEESRLASVSYYTTAEKDVAMALQNVEQSGLAHLNDTVLNKELERLGRKDADNKAIDTLLNTVSP